MGCFDRQRGKRQHFKIVGNLWGDEFVVFPNLVMNGLDKPIGTTGSQAFWDQTLGAAPESPKNGRFWDQCEKKFWRSTLCHTAGLCQSQGPASFLQVLLTIRTTSSAIALQKVWTSGYPETWADSRAVMYKWKSYTLTSNHMKPHYNKYPTTHPFPHHMDAALGTKVLKWLFHVIKHGGRNYEV